MLGQSLYRQATSFKRLMTPGAQMPVYLLMFVTNRCNARCEHCFYWSELNTKVKQELTVNEFDSLARSLGPMLQVTFTGGSPELRKDLPRGRRALLRSLSSHQYDLLHAWSRQRANPRPCGQDTATMPWSEGEDRHFPGWTR